MPNESKEDKNLTIEEITLESWEKFEDAVNKDYQSHEDLKENYPNAPNLLFRGQEKASWELETTLERYVKDKKVTKQEYTWRDYWEILKAIKPDIYSLAEYKPKLGEFFNRSGTIEIPVFDDFMIYIRHHGFPSPLLDWTRSPYVAAYFAFNDSANEDVAIYSYLEKKVPFKSARSNTPQITTYGLSAERKHNRHNQQQGEYTVCFTETEDEGNYRVYTSHEKVQFGDEQDFLKKYIIPSTERKKVLRKLDLMNINAFSLFGNEESLMDTLAYREIENKR